MLGPLFLLIYVDDLLHLFETRNVQILLYADDTIVYFADTHFKHNLYSCRGCIMSYKWCELS